MREISILQLGYGKVGKAFKKLVEDFHSRSDQWQIEWMDIKDSKGSCLRGEKRSDQKKKGRVLLDLTASTQTTEQLIHARRQGWGLVLANKNPLAGRQDLFDELLSGPIGFSATVGSGLPVIPEILKMKAAGKSITRLEACLSGSLGVVCSRLEQGETFSEIIAEAVEKGFTEPDPRTDLSGQDVARKLLILSRLSGIRMDLEQIDCRALFPAPMAELSLSDFMKQLKGLDALYHSRSEQARKEGKTLRFVARLDNGICQVGLRPVPSWSPLGTLTNDEKRILIFTEDTAEPVIITGAGSGPEDTASDLLRDLLSVAASPELHPVEI